jgi:hypothetical protein
MKAASLETKGNLGLKGVRDIRRLATCGGDLGLSGARDMGLATAKALHKDRNPYERRVKGWEFKAAVTATTAKDPARELRDIWIRQAAMTG